MHSVKFDGANLRKLRKDRKWDQHRLAEAARGHGVGITQSQISRYENGQEPSGRNVLALAAALGVTAEALYDADEDEGESRAVAGLSLLDQLYAEITALRARVPSEARTR